MEHIFIIIVLIGIVILILILTSSNEKNEVFEASFVGPNEVGRNSHKGWSLGSSRLYSSLETSYRNQLVVGKSGSGKLIYYVSNSCFNIISKTNHSLLVVNPGGDAYKLLAGYASKHRKVYHVDFSNKDSYGFNALSLVKSHEDITHIVDTLVANSNGISDKSDFWTESAKEFISFWIKVVMTQSTEFQTFANVAILIDYYNSDPQKAELLVVKTSDTELLRLLKGYASTPQNTLGGIVAQARSILAPYYNPAVRATTSQAQSINLDKIRTEPSIVFVNCSIPSFSYLRPIISLFIQSFYDRFLSYIPDPTKELPIHMILDEFSSYKILNASKYLSSVRKHLLPTMILLQQRSSIDGIYGKYESQNIVSNCFVQSYLPSTTDLETTTQLSKMMGDHYRIDNDTEKRVRQPLLSPAEVTKLKDHALTLCGSDFTLIKLKPFFNNPRYKKLGNLPLPDSTECFPDTVPLITL